MLAISLVSNFDAFYRWEHTWVRWLLADSEIVDVYDPELTSDPERAILVVGGDLRGKEQPIINYLERCRARGISAGLLHLSDEYGYSPTSFYSHAAFVFRNYFRPDAIDGKHSRFLPLGYSSRLLPIGNSVKLPLAERQITWSFAGEMKRSRQSMVNAANKIPGGKLHITSMWEDQQALTAEQYSNVLRESVFVLCPVGNRSADTFRLYEALEAGAIPIVEDTGGKTAWLEMLSASSLWRIKPWHERRWRSCVKKMLRSSYWKKVYGRDFPCPRVCSWENLSAAMDRTPFENMGQATATWWENRKKSCRREIAQQIAMAFGDDCTQAIGPSTTLS